MDKIKELIQKGAQVSNPGSVTIGDEVDVGRIAGNGVTVFPGTRISGARTFIAQGARIGAQAPVTIENCYIGPDVALDGGYFNGAVFLRKARCGSGSHVRQGTILEEESSIAHTVGLKQTILFPFVTLGSLINFCDCLMAGGSSRQNHSEVGSSYIHFNYTPNQDKATPSLLGDVPKGVMLNQSPIFLGGQGGLVGPCRIAFGTVLAAGTICRSDQMKENHLVFGAKSRNGTIPYTSGVYYSLKRVFNNNFYYIGNLYALRQWHVHIRSQFVGSELPSQLHDGLIATVKIGIEERIRQLDHLHQKMAETKIMEGPHHEFQEGWLRIKKVLKELLPFSGADDLGERFTKIIEQQIQAYGENYINAIRGLTPDQAGIGTQWMESIVQRVYKESMTIFPSLVK